MAEPAEPDDRELLEAWAAGDKAAGNVLVRRHFEMVHRFFVTKVPDFAEDLTQVTFLGCVESRERFRNESAFKTYLYSIARHKLLHHFRRHGRDEDVLVLGHRSIADLAASPSQIVADSEDQKVLLDALRRIPVDSQIALELYYWEDMTQGEVAEVLGVAEGTAKSRLHQARERIRDELLKMRIPDALRASTMARFER